ncbi:hypothetical protein D3C79_622390 [compost metagenome]
MGADGFVADVQHLGNLQIGQPLAEQAEDLQLFGRQQHSLCRLRFFRHRSGGKTRLPGQHGFNCLHQLFKPAAFMHKPVGAGCPGHTRVDLFFLRGVDQDRLLRVVAADFFQQLQAVYLRQADIQNDQRKIGCGQLGQRLNIILNRLQAIRTGRLH